MFKISHYANSFISIEGNESSLVCDPWIGKTSDNAWYSYPIYNDKEINKKFLTQNLYTLVIFIVIIWILKH